MSQKSDEEKKLSAAAHLNAIHESSHGETDNSHFERLLEEKFHAVFIVDSMKHLLIKVSLHCLGPKNKLRVLCVHILFKKWFDHFITSCIIVNSILLATKQYEGNYDGGFHSSWN